MKDTAMSAWVGGGYPIVLEVIPGPGQYRTRAGEVVTVTRRAGHWAHGSYANGVTESWHRSGRILPCRTTPNDITEGAT